MKMMSKRLVQVFALLVLFPALVPSVYAEWESNFTVKSTSKNFRPTSGKFYSKGDRFRVDTTAPIEMSLYAQADSKRVEAAVHSFQIRLSSSLEKSATYVRECFLLDFQVCIKNYSLKKVREEKCEKEGSDTLCEIFVGTPKKKGVKRLELWHVKGEKEPIFTKSILEKKDGSEVRVEFTDISKKSHPDSFFKVPSTYKNAGSIERFFTDFKSDSE